ncbi:MAG: helix-turn-helix domain-containing protein [Bacteroidaceae bacterium]|nr:helix-turn-helix domain-containing protein [Bacteroidaceae bacterium]
MVAAAYKSMRSDLHIFLKPLLCCLLICAHVAANDSPLHSQRLSTSDGLGSNSVRATLQDQSGYLWVATADGLSRYDGHHFINFVADGSKTPGFITSSVSELYEDTIHHLLWTASPSSQMACFDLQRNTFINVLDSLPADAHLPEVHLSKRNTVFSGEHFGLRQIWFEDGRPHARDFTEANGLLHSNRIFPVAEDRRGTIWIPTLKGLATLTPAGRLRYLKETGVFRAAMADGGKVYVLDDANTLYTYDLDGRLLHRTAIPRQLGSTERVWHHFRWRGLWVIMGREHAILFDPATWQFTAPNGWDVFDGRIVGRTGDDIWVLSGRRDLVLFRPDGQVKTLSLLPQSVLDMGFNARYRIVQTSPDIFYIATNGNGLFRYDARSEALEHYSANDAHPLLHSDYLLHIFKDCSNTLWLSNELVGLTRLTPQKQEVATLLPNNAARRDRSNHIILCKPLSDTTAVVGTRDGNTYIYYTRAQQLRPEGHVAGALYAYFRDSRGRQWQGTRGSGLIVDGRVYTPETEPNRPMPYVYGIAEDGRGRIWMATLADGLICAETRGNGELRFTSLHLTDAPVRINAVCIDRDGFLWAGTADGLYVADARKAQVGRGDFEKVNWGGNNTHHIICLAASASHVWVGTLHDGAVRIHRSSKGSRNVEPVVQATSVMAIVPTHDGGSWMGTDSGYLRWDAHTQCVSSYLMADEDLSNICVMGAATRTTEGDYLFGSYYGLLRIRDPQTESDSLTLRPQVTDILVGDSSLVEAGQYSEGTTAVTLSHAQNNISLHFATLHFTAETSTLYTYWLEGYEEQWLHKGASGTATYEHLPPGHYLFHVKTVGSNAGANDEAVLSIRIRPPWWCTWWAWLLYLVVASSLAAAIIHQLRTRNRLRSRLQLERRLSQFRLDFFTQISHELRAPLALIRSGVERLEAGKGQCTDTAQLQVVGRGSRRLTKLVDQLLLFRRISEDSIRLHPKEADIVQLVRDVCTDFFPLAESRGMTIQFTPFDHHLMMTFDASFIETITYNLVSNAVKYTPSGGSIRVRIPKPEAGQLCISVFNSAQPLTAEQRVQLFKPYMHGFASQGGMGIGLYVAHQLAKLSHGDLTYTEADGGVLFTLMLPAEESEKGRVKSEKYNVADADERYSYSSFDTRHSSFPDSPTPTQLLPRSVNSQSVAIVEDDSDMAEQLRQQVGVFFNVETYADGAEALKSILASPPDLVLCDIMLPSLDGYSIVHRLKENEATSHLPVILLTSLQDDAHHVRGIKSGADAFLTKPCNPEVLVNLMAQFMKKKSHSSESIPADAPTRSLSREGGEASGLREDLQQLVQQFVETPTAEDTIITSLADQRFREQAAQLVTQNLANTGFNADVLAQQMGIGRTLFFRRFKQLLGHSPSEYIRTERMRLAARLLTEDKLNVAEVAQRTGFTDASHFIRAFKAFYGVTPTQFRQV